MFILLCIIVFLLACLVFPDLMSTLIGWGILSIGALLVAGVALVLFLMVTA